jgi:predicted Rdx family selenoprotein
VATYTKIDGKLIQTFEDDVEKVAVVPNDWEPEENEANDITVLDEWVMEREEEE